MSTTRSILCDGMRRAASVLVLALLCLSLAGCQKELYRDLSEATANEMLSALLSHNIQAEKVNLGKSGYSITVDEADQAKALALLRDLGLPKPAFDSLGSVFRKEGMMSSQTEERARMAYALSQEIAASCARLDGVVSARAHVVLSERDLTTGAVTPASAAVMLRYAPDFPVDSYVTPIQKMVLQSVPDVAPERVSVLLFPVQGDLTRPEGVETGAALGVRVLHGQEGSVYFLAVCALVLGVLAGGAGALGVRRVMTTRRKEQEKGQTP